MPDFIYSNDLSLKPARGFSMNFKPRIKKCAMGIYICRYGWEPKPQWSEA